MTSHSSIYPYQRNRTQIVILCRHHPLVWRWTPPVSTTGNDSAWKQRCFMIVLSPASLQLPSSYSQSSNIEQETTRIETDRLGVLVKGRKWGDGGRVRDRESLMWVGEERTDVEWDTCWTQRLRGLSEKWKESMTKRPPTTRSPTKIGWCLLVC